MDQGSRIDRRPPVQSGNGRSLRHYCLQYFIIALLALAGCGGKGSDKTANIQPVANAVCDNTPLNTTLNGDLTSSVTDPDNTVLNFSLVSNGVNGSATIDPTGIFSYSPFFDARGPDSFTYNVDDLSGGTGTGTVTVIIGDTRIMPLGASVTSGVVDGANLLPVPAERVGYRKPLYDSLVAAGFSIDLVGTLTDGFGFPNFDFNHEGHGGWSDEQIAFGRAGEPPPNGVFEWLDANPADVVLLYVGANGLNNAGGTSPDDMENILDQIDAWETTPGNNPITVLLARIVDWNPPNPNVTIFNDNVEAMAQDRVSNPNNPAFPDDIIIVDHQSALGPADMFDQIHPNTSGYAKMADEWLNASTNVLPKCP